jgi:hypothetical protein
VDWESVRVFLRYIQKVQILYVSAAAKGPVTKNDAQRCAKVIYDSVVIRDKIYL